MICFCFGWREITVFTYVKVRGAVLSKVQPVM